jgi:hypothetical protein
MIRATQEFEQRLFRALVIVKAEPPRDDERRRGGSTRDERADRQQLGVRARAA